MRSYSSAVAFNTAILSPFLAFFANTIDFDRWRDTASIIGPHSITKP